MLEEMFGEESNDYSSSYEGELLAVGKYESDPDEILKGFKVFQKKYVLKNTVIQLILVVIAVVIQAVSIITSESGDVSFNMLLILICVLIGVWVAVRPYNTRKNLRKGIENLKGTVYEAEIYTDKIKISTIYDAPVENGITADTEKLASSDKKGLEAVADAMIEQGDEHEEEDIPATIIHLDNAGAEVVECSDMYVVYVLRVNIFVIPKSAFTPEEIAAVNEKLSMLMGIRFKKSE